MYKKGTLEKNKKVGRGKTGWETKYESGRREMVEYIEKMEELRDGHK